VWLDRGELDKIIERSVTPPQPQGRDEYREPSRHSGGYGYKKKKKGGLLGELFDF
jgi:Zn-finger nucleic acid-binding protein